jgi:nicotinic acid mononucleotide adenylyltransferase
VLERLRRPERARFFEIEPNPASSTAVRAGGAVDELVPPAVATLIRQRGLYTEA